jgi:hypothetical protein
MFKSAAMYNAFRSRVSIVDSCNHLQPRANKSIQLNSITYSCIYLFIHSFIHSFMRFQNPSKCDEYLIYMRSMGIRHLHHSKRFRSPCPFTHQLQSLFRRILFLRSLVPLLRRESSLEARVAGDATFLWQWFGVGSLKLG